MLVWSSISLPSVTEARAFSLSLMSWCRLSSEMVLLASLVPGMVLLASLAPVIVLSAILGVVTELGFSWTAVITPGLSLPSSVWI